MKNLFTIILALMAIQSFAKEIKVPEDYKTIQGAIDNSTDGDVIKLGYGHFYEYLNIEKSITIQGIGNTYIHCPDLGTSPFRNPNAVINVKDSEVKFDLVQIYGYKEIKDYNPNMHFGIDASNAMVTANRCSIFGIQKSAIKAKGGSLDIYSLGINSRTIADERTPFGFIIDDVGAVTCTKLFCRKGNVETLFQVNATYPGTRETIISIKESKLGDVQIDSGRKGSYRIVMDAQTKKYYDYTQADLDIEGVEYKYETDVNPILHYRFDGNTNDVSSSKNHGECTSNPKYVKDIWGQPNMALRFDSDAEMNISDINGFNKKEFTCSFWYSNALEDGKGGGVLQSYFTGKEGSVFSIGERSAKYKDSVALYFYVYQKDYSGGESGGNKPMWGKVVIDKKWHHITLSCKAGEKAKIYVDGQLKIERESDKDLLLRTPRFVRLGATDMSGSTNTLGCYDDLRIYNRQLSDREVADLAGMNDENMDENPDEGLSELAPPPPSKDEIENETHDEGLDILAPPPPSKGDKKDSKLIQTTTLNKGVRKNVNPDSKTIKFDVEKGEFTNRYGNNDYSFILPSNLQYNSHSEVKDNLLISYTDTKNGQNYVGIWNKSLQYQAEYNFAKISVKSFDLYFTASKDKYVLIHYADPAHKTEYVGIFNGATLKYVGQYEVTGKTDVKIISTKDNPSASFNDGKSNKTVEFGLIGNKIKEYNSIK